MFGLHSTHWGFTCFPEDWQGFWFLVEVPILCGHVRYTRTRLTKDGNKQIFLVTIDSTLKDQSSLQRLDFKGCQTNSFRSWPPQPDGRRYGTIDSYHCCLRPNGTLPDYNVNVLGVVLSFIAQRYLIIYNVYV